MQVSKSWPVLTVVWALWAAACSTPQRPPSTAAQKTRPVAEKPAAKSKSTTAQDQPIPVQAIAHYAAGLTYDLNGQAELAMNEYSAAALANPSHEPVVVEAIRRFIRARKPDKAIEILTRATASPNASGALYSWLGLAYGQAGQTALAIRANRAAIQKMPRALPAYQNLAQIYLQSGQTNEAVRVLDEAARQSTVDAAFLVDLAELYVRFGRTKNPKDDAIQNRVTKSLDRAAKLNPTNPVILEKLGDRYSDLGDFAKAEPVYAQLLKTYPRLSPIRGKLADLYIRMGRKDQAIEQLEEIARVEPANARVLAFLGALLLAEQKIDQAVQHFETAIRRNPDLEQVYYELAAVKIINLKKPEDGLALLSEARSRFKPSFAMEFYAGLAHVLLKKFAEGIKHLTAAEILAKTGEPNRLTHQFYYQLGAAFEKNENLDQAEKHFYKCLELSPDSADAMNYLGYMWAERGIKLEQAHMLIQRAVELEPANAAFLDSLAWVLFKLNQPKNALALLLRAIELTEEPDATLYDHLGDIYASLEEFAQARAAWRKSMNLEPNEHILRKLEAAASSGTAPP